jgi:transposase
MLINDSQRSWSRFLGDPGSGRYSWGVGWFNHPPRADTANGVVYLHAGSQGREHPIAHLSNFTGALQADGYAGYDAVYEGGE